MASTVSSWLRLPTGLLEDIQLRIQRLSHPPKFRSGNVELSSVGSDSSDGLLKGEFNTPDSQQPRWLRRPTSFFESRSRRFWAIAGGTTVLLFLLLAAGSTKPEVIKDAYQSITTPVLVAPPRDERTFYMLAPAGHVELPMCRSILSSSILQYPTMYYAELDEKLDPAGQSRERNLARLDSIQKFLHDLPDRRDNDTILVLDERSSWFQLRPEVLLQRYLDINYAANQRLDRAYGGASVTEAIGISQNIIFTAQKVCVPDLTGSTVCTALPEAPDSLNSHYLGTGIQIGSVKAMRALYDYAGERARGGTTWNSMHMLMTLIFGEQEIQRKRFLDLDHSSLPRKNATTGRLAGEFSIGLDYEGLLSSAPTSNSDLAFIRHDETSLEPVPLAEDIVASEAPFWTVSGVGSAGLPDSTRWSDLPLLTNTRTRVVPAIVHTDKKASIEEWRQWWMAEHARELLDQVLVEDSPAAIVVDPRSGVEQRFWAPTWHKPGYNVLGGEFKRWEESECATEEVAEAVFGDKLGPWKNPYY